MLLTGAGSCTSGKPCYPFLRACAPMRAIAGPDESVRAAKGHTGQSVRAMRSRLGSGVRMCRAQHVAASVCVKACEVGAC
eukprot:6185119-Pleurochrysis_carterae.AAC.1